MEEAEFWDVILSEVVVDASELVDGAVVVVFPWRFFLFGFLGDSVEPESSSHPIRKREQRARLRKFMISKVELRNLFHVS